MIYNSHYASPVIVPMNSAIVGLIGRSKREGFHIKDHSSGLQDGDMHLDVEEIAGSFLVKVTFGDAFGHIVNRSVRGGQV